MKYNLNYPDLYYQVYSKVMDAVSKYINTGIESISKENIDEMIDEVYGEMIKLYPEVNKDPIERRNRVYGYDKMKQGYYSRRKLLRDFISVILISELLRRTYPYNY